MSNLEYKKSNLGAQDPQLHLCHPTGIFGLAFDAYSWFDLIANQFKSIALLVMRFFFGIDLVQTAIGHLTHVDQTTDFFTSLHVPFPRVNVYISGYTELFGGALLFIGLFSRLISLPLVFNFIVAYATASKDNVALFFHSLIHWSKLPDAVGKIDGDAAFFFLITALVVLAFGPGKISVDHVLSRTVFRRYRNLLHGDFK